MYNTVFHKDTAIRIGIVSFLRDGSFFIDIFTIE